MIQMPQLSSHIRHGVARYLPLLLVALILAGCQSNDPTFRIFEKPIRFDEEREQLSLEYMRNRHGIEAEQAVIDPRMVVVHWTAVHSIEETFDVFNPVRLRGRQNLQGASSLNVSSQFLVDRDGSIFRLLPDTTFARHTIGLNYMAIGIENIGGSQAPLTRAQLKANTDLITWLAGKYDIEYVIGHHEYQDFRGSDVWKETDPDYLTDKIDPGPDFMRRLRKELEPLTFKSAPD
ncbi:MAG: peptidoglycan recognition family protein [Cyclonatronaceae bacterium]